jgi:hypothetical protein
MFGGTRSILMSIIKKKKKITLNCMIIHGRKYERNVNNERYRYFG